MTLRTSATDASKRRTTKARGTSSWTLNVRPLVGRRWEDCMLQQSLCVSSNSSISCQCIVPVRWRECVKDEEGEHITSSFTDDRHRHVSVWWMRGYSSSRSQMRWLVHEMQCADMCLLRWVCWHSTRTLSITWESTNTGNITGLCEHTGETITLTTLHDTATSAIPPPPTHTCIHNVFVLRIFVKGKGISFIFSSIQAIFFKRKLTSFEKNMKKTKRL